MLREFRNFVNKGNFVDVAVAFVMGVAFSAVTTALTGRIVSPLVGMLVNIPDMSRYGMFGPVDPESGMAVGSVGAFVEALINFVVIAFVAFVVVRLYNRFREKETTPDPPDTVLLREIRDELRSTRP